MVVKKLLIINFLVLLLTACTTIKQKHPNISWNKHQKNISNISSWYTTGKIGFTNGKEGGTANLEWKQQQQNFDIMLHGPLKMGALHIIKEDNKTILENSDGNKQSANSPEEILSQYGWIVPVSCLNFWARGISVPEFPIELLQLTNNKLHILQQQGWKITYFDYQTSKQHTLPKKIQLEYDKIKVKFIFKNWLVI